MDGAMAYHAPKIFVGSPVGSLPFLSTSKNEKETGLARATDGR